MVKWVQQAESPSGMGRNPQSYQRLDEWHRAVIGPLQNYLPLGQPVFLAPFNILHLLPLAAARHPKTGRYVAEDYQIAFVFSLSALHIVWDQHHRTGRNGQVVPHRLLNVAYPGIPGTDDYLSHVQPEAEAIAKLFAQVTSLYHEAATPDAVVAQSQDKDVIHFGCHGWFDPEHPEQSGLMLVGGWLTVRRVITELRLEQALLATLGACRSGLAELQVGDEYVGLMQALLTTGVPVIIASIWKVDDPATRVLFETFYTKLVAGCSPAKALQEATRNVRQHPGWAHPYYWAAFQINGLAYGVQGTS
jgi:CHAT domain-containing protein